MANNVEFIRNLFRIILLLWFLVISAFVFVPSYKVFRDARSEPVSGLPGLPVAPEPESIKAGEDAKLAAQRVAAYQHQVKLFEHRIKAYEKEVDVKTAGFVSTADAFELVVKDTLLTLVAQFLTALFAYVFVNAGAQVLDNRQRIKGNQAPERIRLL